MTDSHRPLLVARISRGADSWCSLQQRAINANNQIAFVTETRANYSRYESERGKKSNKAAALCFLLSSERCVQTVFASGLFGVQQARLPENLQTPSLPELPRFRAKS